MANHYYIISEVQFFRDKEDSKTWDFVSGTEIDLDAPCNSKIPSLTEVKNALVAFGLETKEILINITGSKFPQLKGAARDCG